MDNLAHQIKEYLPPLYELRDLENCKETDVYCEGEFTLYPTNNNSMAWKIIQEAQYKKRFYSFRKLVKIFCLDNNSQGIEYYKYVSNNLIDNNVKSLELTSKVDNLICTTNPNGLVLYDYIVMSFIVTYLIFLAFTNPTKRKSQNTILKCFSIRDNIRALSETPRNLKFVEGLRTLIMLAVMKFHSQLGFSCGFVKNPEDLYVPEDNDKLNNFSFYIVQYFFVLTGWFLACKISDIIDKNGTLQFTDVVKLIISRFLRFFIPTFIIILVCKSNWIEYFFGGKSLGRFHQVFLDGCKNNWIPMALFYNNFNMADPCLVHGWSLSVDLQLYCGFLIVLYIFHKFRINFKMIVWILPLVFAIHVYRIYVNLKSSGITDDMFTLINFYFSIIYSISYFSTLSSTMTFIIAMYFGLIYHENKNKQLFNNQITKIVLSVTILASIFGVFTISTRGDGIIKSILLAALKPIYGFGWCLLLLAMTQNIFNWLQKIFEWKIFLYLANFSFSTYLTHVSIIGIKILAQEKYFIISDYNLLENLILNVVGGIMLGFIFHIVFDKPIQRLLNLCVPRISIKPNTHKMQ